MSLFETALLEMTSVMVMPLIALGDGDVDVRVLLKRELIVRMESRRAFGLVIWATVEWMHSTDFCTIGSTCGLGTGSIVGMEPGMTSTLS